MRSTYLFCLLGIFCLLLFSHCKTPYYIANDFELTTVNHSEVAVLPFEVIFVGKIPDELSENDILQLEEAESKALQIAFFDAILRSTNRNKNPIRVDLQDYRKTVQLLEEKEIGIRESWYLDSKELSQILGVDAVVSARIEKAQFFSDLESYGIDLAVHIVNILSNYRFIPFLPTGASVNKNVHMSFYLNDRVEDRLLWQIQYQTEADWRSSTEQIMAGITSRAAKHFPYRIPGY